MIRMLSIINFFFQGKASKSEAPPAKRREAKNSASEEIVQESGRPQRKPCPIKRMNL